MKLALAQIDMRMGDIDEICTRIEAQARLAAVRGASVLCTPAPLFAGTYPGALIQAPDFEHDLLRGLTGLAKSLSDLDIICLVPAAVMCGDAPLFEVFMLKHGRAVPARSTIAISREMRGADLWAPPVFDVAGVRVALTFEAMRDLPDLMPGVDLLIDFPVAAFNVNDSSTCGVAGLEDSELAAMVRERSLWFARMMPVGAYDEAVFTGGTFVLDDCARLVAAAPVFEEALVVQEVSRGVTLPAVDAWETARFDREGYLWRSLTSYVRASVRAQGQRRAVVVLEGDLPSAVTAALCVDALGSRNVLGVTFAPAESDELNAARESASGLGIRLIERESVANDFDAQERSLTFRYRVQGLFLEEAARAFDGVPISSLTKTHYALCPAAFAGSYTGTVAPLGDVYLSSLKFLAHARTREGFCVSHALTADDGIRRDMDIVKALAVENFRADAPQRAQLYDMLGALEPGDIDAALEAHVDKNLGFDDIPLARSNPRAAALLCMIVRKGESARRMLPPAAIVSARSFAERAWPRTLAWSDMGLKGDESLTVDALARAEIERNREIGGKQSERMKSEFMGMLGNLLGISPEQMEALRSEEGQMRVQANLEKFEGQVQDAIEDILRSAGTNPDDGSDATLGNQGFFSPN